MRKKISSIFQFIGLLISAFFNDNVLKYSASLAYYTIFSLAPMLVIIISICSTLFGKEAVQGELYGQISALVGETAAFQIQESIKNIHLSNASPIATTVSVVVLLIGGTGIFGEIQDSLNKIWGLKVKAHKAWWKLIINRLLSFSLIISLGFVLMVSLLLSTLITVIGNHINQYIAGASGILIPIVNNLVTFGVITFLFAIIFKVLPDARIKWKDVLYGAVVTAVLFVLGKFAIGFYLGRTQIVSLYGAAGSVVIIMLWAYYSSMILYIGAVFTKLYTNHYGRRIEPNDYAVWIKTEEIVVNKPVLKSEQPTNSNFEPQNNSTI